MNIGFISTRLAGTDGVSLETAKLATVLRRMGHDIFYCAGELDGDAAGLLALELHFTDATAVELGARAFGSKGVVDPALVGDIEVRAGQLAEPIRQFLLEYGISFLIVQNAFAIPMQLPLAKALADLLTETGLPALAHNHDFHWERDRFANSLVPDFLEHNFPPDLPNLRHAVINSRAGRELKARRGIDSILIPNVFDFETPAPGIDGYNADFRRAIGLKEDDWLILQPTRVVARKGIELALELVARLEEPRAKLIITHEAGDEGMDYLHFLQGQAATLGVDMRYVAEYVDDTRRTTEDGGKIYSLWDSYPHADLVSYPSLYEGFGNALIESIYFRRPALVNRYAVYAEDIAPLGFQFVELDGEVSDEAVAAVKDILSAPSESVPITENNFDLGRRHFSYNRLAHLLQGVLGELPA